MSEEMEVAGIKVHANEVTTLTFERDGATVTVWPKRKNDCTVVGFAGGRDERITEQL